MHLGVVYLEFIVSRIAKAAEPSERSTFAYWLTSPGSNADGNQLKEVCLVTTHLSVIV